MTTVADQLQALYVDLTQVLHNPEAFDLGSSVPPQLRNALEKALTTIGQTADQLRLDSADDFA